MIDVLPTNSKLIDRATRIIAELTGVEYNKAREYLFRADKNVKLAVVMLKKNVDKKEAQSLLDNYNGKLRLIID